MTNSPIPPETLSFRERLRLALAVPPRLVALYILVYIPWGFAMNAIGQTARIAEFAHWWQVLTCYGLYLIPASLLVRGKSVFEQYLGGLLTLAPLELAGYALGSSRAFPGNLLDRVLGERNFSLAMVVFFAGILPVGNALVAALERRVGRR